MKEAIISTGRLNCYGSRILTSGIDITQYSKNPILCWMHQRPLYDRESLPIGRMENLRIEGDCLIGTPVFDLSDEFAKKISEKWDKGFLKMVSAGIEILDTSLDQQYLVPGQSRATITKCKLDEVSIVDIGANDDALQLYNKEGALLKLSTGEADNILPLVGIKEIHNEKEKDKMNKEILQLLGLADDASDKDVIEKIKLMKKDVDEIKTMKLAGVTAVVEQAVRDKKITADKKATFMKIGEESGVETLTETLSLMSPAVKPNDIIDNHNDNKNDNKHKEFVKLSDVPTEEVRKLKEDNPEEYARLYKAEYGVEL